MKYSQLSLSRTLRDLKFVSTLPRVGNRGILFVSNLCNLSLPGI